MNEHEFRQALHDTMTVATPPAWMNESPVLDLAKRAHRRRQATWASAGSAVAVMAVVAGAMVLTPNGDDGAPSVTVGGTGTSSDTTASTGTEPPGSGIELSGDETKPPWPNGQTDATATAGAEYDRGVQLIDELTGAAPDGFETPDGLVYADPAYEGGKLRNHQAAWLGKTGDADVWSYLAYLPVSANGGVGKLYVDVISAPNDVAGEGCALSMSYGSEASRTCEEVTVGGVTVGVVTDTGPSAEFDQLASYRHADGTVVFVAQDTEFKGSGQQPLATAPFTSQQLAELATDARFHLG
jgi:hypothetical protein